MAASSVAAIAPLFRLPASLPCLVLARQTAIELTVATTANLGPAVKRYHVTTFGCQMNEHDSERLKGMLESLGYAESPDRENADLIVFNTCSIREKADNRLAGHLGEAKRLKTEDPT